MRSLIPAITLLMCSAGSYALADTVDTSLPVDSRIKLLRYDEADVYVINTRYGYETNIVFSDNEEIQMISVGDRSLWQIIPSGHRLFIRPMEDGVSTNMTVISNKHSYQFDLKSSAGGKGGTAGNMYVAKFVYPEDKPKAASTTVSSVTTTSTTVVTPASAAAYTPPSAPVVLEPAQPIHSNYNYTFSGPDELAPMQVYDDGRSTYIKYRDPHQPLPNVYLVDAHGHEQLATSYQKDHAMVVDAVAPELALKNSNGTIHVYNETLNPR